MWFKRKAQNRRLGRNQVLDVKLRSSQVRAARMRLAAVTGGVVFATVFGVYLAWRGGVWALNEFVYANSAFAIQNIEISTDGSLPAERIRRWTGVKPGDNLLALDLGRVKRDLELVAVIQSVSVERVLPHALRIHVVEREPIAQASLPRPRASGGVELATFFLDSEGYAMPPGENRARDNNGTNSSPDAWPVISGLTAAEVQLGRRIESRQLQAALRFLLAFERSPMNGLVDLKRVDITPPEALLVSTGQGSEVVFGLDDMDQQLRRWYEIFEAGQRTGRSLATLDLAISNNIPARWLEASAAPALLEKPSKPLRIRKKHV
jgi:hypothetical protein